MIVFIYLYIGAFMGMLCAMWWDCSDIAAEWQKQEWAKDIGLPNVWIVGALTWPLAAVLIVIFGSKWLVTQFIVGLKPIFGLVKYCWNTYINKIENKLESV